MKLISTCEIGPDLKILQRWLKQEKVIFCEITLTAMIC